MNKWGMSQINRNPNNNGAYLVLVFSNNKFQASVVDCLEVDKLDETQYITVLEYTLYRVCHG